MSDVVRAKEYEIFIDLESGILTVFRSNTVVGNALEQPFRWGEALDALADTYNAVWNLCSGD